MEIKFRKIKEGVETPEFKKGIASIKCVGIKHGIGKDHRMVLVYESGLEVEIPENKIGLVIPSETAYLNSIEFAGGMQVLSPGFKGEIISMFKTNTDSVPSIYEAGEEFARLLIVDYPAYEVAVEEFTQEPQAEQPQEVLDAEPVQEEVTEDAAAE